MEGRVSIHDDAVREALITKLVNARNRAATLESINRGLEKDLQAVRTERLELYKKLKQANDYIEWLGGDRL
jgi:hypothetical protein